jgi:hypothetical protein
MTQDKELESVAWSVRPYEQAPHKRWVVLVAALLAMGAGIFVFGELLLGILGFVIILGSTMDFWLGTSYKVSPSGASSRTGLSFSSISWEEAKRVVIGRQEIKVSPLEDGNSRLDAFRGVILKLTEANREQVEDAVRKFGGNHVRFLEG